MPNTKARLPRLSSSICRFLPAALAASLALGCGSEEYTVDAPTTAIMNGGDWRDEVIYQVIVDRFADGDINNNWRVRYGALGRFQGGDWQGVIDRLDYLKTLGVTAIWISPVVRNVDFDAGFDSYHGYWAQDLEKVNPHFGSPAKLRELTARAHSQGIKVILDIVTNHMSQLFYYDINGNGQPDTIWNGMYGFDNLEELSRLWRRDEYDPDYTPETVQGWSQQGPTGPAPIRFLYMPEIARVPPPPIRYGAGEREVLDFTRPAVWYKRGRVTNYDMQDQLTGGDFPGGLKDLNTTREEVRKGLIKAFAELIRKYDFDGFRIDTLKHVEHEFWQTFSPAIRKYVRGEGPLYGVPALSVPKKNWFMFGEAFDGDDALLGEFTYNDEIESVFYFSQKFQVYDDVVKCSQPTKKVENLWNDRLRYGQGARNHEEYRSCFMGGRCFRETAGGGRTRDIAQGKPIYNQEPINLGPVDSMGRGIPPSKLLVNFLDNHDVARYLSPLSWGSCVPNAEEAVRRLHNALALMFAQDGIPCVYYGTEQEFAGGNDPANRERLFDTVLGNAWIGRANGQREPLANSGYETSGKTFQWISRLSAVRKAYAPLRRGDLRIAWSTEHTGTESDAGILAFVRTYDNKSALVVTNVHNTQASETRDGTAQMTTPFPAGTKLVDVLKDPYETGANEEITVQASGKVVVRVSSRATRILVPEGDVVPVK